LYEPARKLDLDAGADGACGAAGKFTIRPTAYIGVLFCLGFNFFSGDSPRCGKG
jgi:hypothetical protein